MSRIKEFVLMREKIAFESATFSNAWASTDNTLTIQPRRLFDRYIRNEISSPIAGFADRAYAGIAEFWRTDDPPQLERRNIPSIATLDRNTSVSFLAREVTILPGRGPVKFMSLLRRKSSLSSTAFSAAWQDKHADVVRSVGEVWGLFRGYVQNHIVPGTCRLLDGSGMERPFDGIVEIWFDSLQDLERAMMSERYREVVRPDEMTFVDLPNTRLFATEVCVDLAGRRAP
jgi:hypothetical protein